MTKFWRNDFLKDAAFKSGNRQLVHWPLYCVSRIDKNVVNANILFQENQKNHIWILTATTKKAWIQFLFRSFLKKWTIPSLFSLL